MKFKEGTACGILKALIFVLKITNNDRSWTPNDLALNNGNGNLRSFRQSSDVI